jgi:hypothetical protein
VESKQQDRRASEKVNAVLSETDNVAAPHEVSAVNMRSGQGGQGNVLGAGEPFVAGDNIGPKVDRIVSLARTVEERHVVATASVRRAGRRALSAARRGIWPRCVPFVGS